MVESLKKSKKSAVSISINPPPQLGYSELGYGKYKGLLWHTKLPRQNRRFVNRPLVEELVNELKIDGPLCPTEDCKTDLSIKKRKCYCPQCDFKQKIKLSEMELRDDALRFFKSSFRNRLLKDPSLYEKFLGAGGVFGF